MPPGEYNQLETLMGEWQALTGFQVYPSSAQLLKMANQGILTLSDFGKFMSTQSNFTSLSKAMPWATYGLDKDTYTASVTTFAMEYKKLTGQDIPPDQVTKAFEMHGQTSGALLTGSQYAQQLMNDAAIQKQYGWVKYGLDFTAWTQQKLQMRSAFGHDIQDAQAATILQYTHAATGSNLSAVGRSQGQQQGPQAVGVGGSVAR